MNYELYGVIYLFLSIQQIKPIFYLVKLDRTVKKCTNDGSYGIAQICNKIYHPQNNQELK